jgi:hypothetical protein
VLISIQAQVSDITDVIALFDCLQFVRSTVGVGGTYEEITAEEETPAQATGTISGPFAGLSGRILEIILSGGEALSVTFTAEDLRSTLEAINAVLADLAAESGTNTGKVKITSPLKGSGSTLLLSGTALTILGLPSTKAVGKEARPLLTIPTEYYTLRDFDGDPAYYYKYRCYHSQTRVTGAFSSPIRYDPNLQYLDASKLSLAKMVWVRNGRPVVKKRVRFVSVLPLNHTVIIAGTGTISSSGGNVTGENTKFLTEMGPGQKITADGQPVTVQTIASDVACTVSPEPSPAWDDESFTISRPLYTTLPDVEAEEVTSTWEGKVEISLVRGQAYTVHFEDSSYSRTFTVPNQAEFDLFSVLSISGNDPFDIITLPFPT